MNDGAAGRAFLQKPRRPGYARRYPTNTFSMNYTRRAFRGVLLASLWLLVVTPSGCNRAHAPARQKIGRSIEFIAEDEIEGSDLVIKTGATILIGETHGTWEIPVAVASLMRIATREGLEAVVCVELAASEQSSLNEFISSDGGPDAADALLRSPHWNNQDGRASIGMFAMLELIRRLKFDGRNVRVIAMDSDWAPHGDLASLSAEEIEEIQELANGRDSEMAKSVVRVRKESPNALIMAFAGNVHTNVNKGAPWDDTYIPMGWYVIQEIPNAISLNTETAGGEAWVTTDKGTGPTTFRGKDHGDHPFVEMNVNADTGYHGCLYVGPITAAKPAVVINGGQVSL